MSQENHQKLALKKTTTGLDTFSCIILIFKEQASLPIFFRLALQLLLPVIAPFACNPDQNLAAEV